MADPAPRLKTSDEVLAWQRLLDERYERVDGVPVLRTG